jgi:hypothetical protein
MNKTFFYKNKVIGILEDGIFRKTVDKSRHFMRINHSWGIDLETFKELPDDTQILLMDDVNQKIYRTDWQTYAENGTVENYGHGRQIMLKEDKFNV